MQHTLKNQVIFKGIGLHSGEPVTMIIHPAGADEGIQFVRQDIDDKNNIIPAKYDLVEQSQLCTKLKNKDGVSISTIEHVMAALVGCGVDNATVILDGPEVPIRDGSSLEFVEAFQKVGFEKLNTEREAIKILKTIEVQGEDGSFARFEPHAESVFEFTIDFENRFIGRQHMEFTLGDHQAFHNELADSPTFTTKDTIDYLRSIGLIKGGAITNADVYADDAIYRDTSRPRKEKAAVRHKLLDAIGDCGLAGAPIIGKFVCEKGGHALTNQLLRKLMDETTTYMMVTDTFGIAQPQSENLSSTSKLAYNA